MKYLNSGIIFLIILVGSFYVLIGGLHRETADGEHTGYIGAVERNGLFFKTFRAYIKTDPQSSQENEYCVVDPKIYSQLEEMAQQKTQVTVSYFSWLVSGLKSCSGEDAVIFNVIPTADIANREADAKKFVDKYTQNDPEKLKQISDIKQAILKVKGREATYSEVKELLDSLK